MCGPSPSSWSVGGVCPMGGVPAPPFTAARARVYPPRVLQAIHVLPHAVVETLKISAPTVIEAARGRLDHPLYDRRLRKWAKKLIDYVDMNVRVRGKERVAPGESYVVMSNHQSVYDIPVVFVALDMLSIRMVAKAGLFRVPIWGRALKIAGF